MTFSTLFNGRGSHRVSLRPNLLAGLMLGATGACAAGTLPVLATGANVDESLVAKTYHVDAANADAADDDKHGTSDAPFATVSYACQTAERDKDHHVGVKVLIAAGTYRETVEIHSPTDGVPDTDAPLVIESAERGQAVIDGADTGGWTPSTWKVEGANGWTHAWPFRRNQAQQAARVRTLAAVAAPPSASGAAYRRGDLVFVNGVLLRQVNRREDLAPGCFWGRAPVAATVRREKSVSAPAVAPDAEAAVFVQPPEDTPLDGAIIQVGIRDHGLVIRGRRNVVVRGLLLQHAAAPVEGDTAAGLWLDGCSNVLVEDVYSQWNDGAGCVITGRTTGPASVDFTLRQVHLLHNGGSGLAASNIGNLLVEDGEACFNNFRGEWADWIDPTDAAGIKTTSVRGSTWLRLRAIGNTCRGIWWDGGNANVTLEDGTIRDNATGGLLMENDPGPVLMRRCLVAGTKARPEINGKTTWPAGVSIAATPDVTLESNVVAGNAGAQLALWDAPAASKGTSVRPELRPERHRYRHNVFYGADANEPVYSLPSPDAAGKHDRSPYYDTLDTSGNCFWNPVLDQWFLPARHFLEARGCRDQRGGPGGHESEGVARHLCPRANSHGPPRWKPTLSGRTRCS